MKRNILIIAAFALLLSCGKNKQAEKAKEEAPKEETQSPKDDLVSLSGEFLYLADAAVLKQENQIYGVVLDSMTMQLSKEVNALKRDDFDMVPVTVKAKIKPNPMKEGWDEVIEIKEIIKVSKPTGESSIKIKGDK